VFCIVCVSEVYRLLSSGEWKEKLEPLEDGVEERRDVDEQLKREN